MVFQIVEKPVEFFFPDEDFSSRNQYLSNETKIIILAFLERLACEIRLFQQCSPCYGHGICELFILSFLWPMPNVSVSAVSHYSANFVFAK